MGRPRQFNTPAEWEHTVSDFIRFCEENGEIPSDWNLVKFAGMSVRTLERYMASQGRYAAYDPGAVVLKKYREHWFARAALEARNPAAALFALKQPKNGGWSDVQTVKQDSTLHVVVGGVGGSGDAFK